MNNSRMPWGKHRGEVIESLSDDYLLWLFKDSCFKSLNWSSQLYVKSALRGRGFLDKEFNLINQNK